MTRRIRLATGLILFVFVTGHLLNHAAGLHSLAAMEAGREWFTLIWRNPIGSFALVVSLVAHLLLAAWALYSLRSLRMSAGEAFQLVFGFSPCICKLRVCSHPGYTAVSVCITG